MDSPQSSSINWRRNLIVLTVVQLLSTAGFSLIFPFLPLYVRELEISTGGSVEFWAGMIFSAQAITMAVAAPIWGSVADRSGRKAMLARATLGGAVVVALMGFAVTVEQLVLLRAAQGMVSGVVAATNALVAANTPRTHTGSALGIVNMSRWGGAALGPIMGGFLGEHFGFRESFWITGILLGLAGIAVLFWVHEEFVPKPQAQRPSFFASYARLIRAPGMKGLYSLTFLRSMGATLITPIIALFILNLNANVEQGAATITGLTLGAAALTSAISAVYLGRLGDRIGHNKVLIASAVAAMLLHIPQVFVQAPWQMILLQGLAGIALGGLVPSTAALMNFWAPTGSQGATYGLDNSVQAGARVFAPMLSALIAATVGFRGVFAATAAIYLVIALVAVQIVRSARARHAVTVGLEVTAGE